MRFDRHPRFPLRLVAIDLDGTLLTDAKAVTPETVQAFRQVAQAGVRLVIASARPPRSVRPFHRHLGLDTLTINYNGALIWDEPAQRIVEHLPLAADLAREIVALARGQFPEVLVSCEVLDRWYTDTFDQPYTTETGRLFQPDLVAPLEQFLHQPVTKLMLLGEAQMIQLLHGLLRNAFGERCHIVRSDAELLQIMSLQATKAAALTRVATHYRVPLEQVMAIGDAVNDLPMLDVVGLAVAMDNAHPDVKDAAHWVAPSNNDHGVAAALRQFILDRLR
jgi:Cof subfamily protein (haloacid dehalogenase superfamily)